MFVSHARNPEELKAEFCGDLQRRLKNYDMQLRNAPSATEKAKLSRVIVELTDQLQYWQDLLINRPKRKPAAAEQAANPERL